MAINILKNVQSRAKEKLHKVSVYKSRLQKQGCDSKVKDAKKQIRPSYKRVNQ